MVGDGPDLEKCKDLVNKYKLSEKVNFVGKSKEISDILSKTDLFLLPSEKESFGLVALEAMMFSTPVITTKGSGVSDLIHHNKNGFYSPLGDTDKMSKDCIKLLTNNNLYSSFSQSAYERAKEFSVEKILPQYEKIYLSF